MADTKPSDFTHTTALTDDDTIPVIEDEDGTPANRQITWANLAKAIQASSWRQVKVKTATESVANTTLQNDDHLSFSIGANETWIVTAHLYTQCAVNTVDIKVAMALPAGATARGGMIGAATTVTGTEGDGKFQSHSNTTIVAGVQASSNNDGYAVYSGYVANGATAGTVNLQFAQFNSDAGNAVSLLTGSFLIAERVS